MAISASRSGETDAGELARAAIKARMAEQHVSHAELARRIGRSRAHVTNLLRRPILSMRTLDRITHALETRVALTLEPDG